MAQLSNLIVHAPQGLLRVEEARSLLAECRGVDEAKDIRDKTAAIAIYLREQGASKEAQADAWEIKFRAETRIGELLEPDKEKRGPKKSLPTTISKDESSRWQQRARFARDSDAFERFIEAERKRLMSGKGDRDPLATSSHPDYDANEWYTPESVIAAARAVLGEIDLDPASNEHAQRTVRAKRFYTKLDDGLSRPWAGRVFCNPPYSAALIEQFTGKLVEEWKADRISAAIYLVNNCTDAAWCQLLLRMAPVCLTAGRIPFMDKTGQQFATRQGQAIFYLGERADVFAQEFDKIGTVVARLPA